MKKVLSVIVVLLLVLVLIGCGSEDITHRTIDGVSIYSQDEIDTLILDLQTQIDDLEENIQHNEDRHEDLIDELDDYLDILEERIAELEESQPLNEVISVESYIFKLTFTLDNGWVVKAELQDLIEYEVFVLDIDTEDETYIQYFEHNRDELLNMMNESVLIMTSLYELSTGH